MAQQDQPTLDQNHLCRELASFGAAYKLHLYTILGVSDTLERHCASPTCPASKQ